MVWVVALDAEGDHITIDAIGGKAAGLRKLLRAGFRVPRGYVVTTNAFKQTLRHALDGLETPEQMREAVLSCDVPVEVERGMSDMHQDMFGDRTVSVRSSAITEDGENYSFAGQLESVLEVSGFEAVLQAVRTVWASYFGRANLLYRGRAPLDGPPSAVAVVVQEMLDPRTAGVMFTADPVGGDRNRLVISATAGTGEAVVEGRSAETVYVDLQSREVLRHVPSSDLQRRELDDGLIHDLVGAGVRINELCGAPQDVEWASDDSGIALLQCRPITAGRAQDEPRGATVWSNVNVGEALPGVATPMTWSITRAFSRLGFEKAFGALGLSIPSDYEFFASFRGRIYLNLTQFASVFSQIPFMKIRHVLAAGGGGQEETLERVGFEKHSKLGFLSRLPLTFARMAISQTSMPTRARRWSTRFKRRRDRFFETPLPSLPRSELRVVLSELDRDFNRTGSVMLACGSNFLSSYILTSQLLERWGGVEAAAKEQHLFSGLRGLASAEPGLQLLDMAYSIRQHPRLEQIFAETPVDRLMDELDKSSEGRQIKARLEQFLREFGNRAVREAEVSTPRWRDHPEFLLEVLKSHLKSPFLPTRDAVEDERMRARQETTEMLRQYFRPGLGVVFRGVLFWTQENARLREELRSRVTDTLSMYRHFFMEAGRRLVAEGAIAEPEDVFFLTRPEVDAYLKQGVGTTAHALTVAMRRAEYVAFSESPDPPDTFVLHGHDKIPEAKEGPPPDTQLLEGLSASPGRVTGRARVFKGMKSEPNIMPGEIIVASFTDVGWTPLFLLASGVVADIGGPLSHAAVVAREYGIPAVVNVKEATNLIQTGDLITVDGDTGRVYLKK